MTIIGFLERGPFRPYETPLVEGYPWGVEAAAGGIVALAESREDAFALAEILNRAYRKSLGERG